MKGSFHSFNKHLPGAYYVLLPNEYLKEQNTQTFFQELIV